MRVAASRALAIVALLCVARRPLLAQYEVIPRPAVLTPRRGQFQLRATTALRADVALLPVARRFARDIADATGFDLRAVSGAARAGSTTSIWLVRDGTLPSEGYALDVTADAVTVRASTPAGAFYGLETFKQLLPPAIDGDARTGVSRWTAAAVHIEDAPRFAWRGAHFDVARHFMPNGGARDRDARPCAGGGVRISAVLEQT